MTTQKDPEANELKFLNKHADFRGKRVLEIGCGDGRLTWKYAGSASQVAGIDVERDELRIAAIDRPSDLVQSSVLALADAVKLPFATDLFDFVLFSWSF
jgi:ubiquinone/menaquinone biosynthesis C-methylase UbiE